MLSHEHDERDFGDSAHPRIANQLWIERKQAVRCLRVSARRGLAVDQAFRPVQLSDSIDVGNKFVSARERPVDLELQIFFRIWNSDSVILSEFLKQMDTLMHHAVPGITFAVLKRCITKDFPFLEQRHRAVFTSEVSTDSRFKAAAKNHGSAGIFFSPAVQIAVAIGYAGNGDIG